MAMLVITRGYILSFRLSSEWFLEGPRFFFRYEVDFCQKCGKLSLVQEVEKSLTTLVTRNYGYHLYPFLITMIMS